MAFAVVYFPRYSMEYYFNGMAPYIVQWESTFMLYKHHSIAIIESAISLRSILLRHVTRRVLLAPRCNSNHLFSVDSALSTGWEHILSMFSKIWSSIPRAWPINRHWLVTMYDTLFSTAKVIPNGERHNKSKYQCCNFAWIFHRLLNCISL